MKLGSIWKIAAIAGVVVAAKRLLAGTYEEVIPVKERRAQPDPEALKAAADANGRVGLDLDRLKNLEQSAYKPLVEYLTYIQVQRGDAQSLVFVRQRDIDSLAELTGESKDSFVEEFKQLGVLLSMN